MLENSNQDMCCFSSFDEVREVVVYANLENEALREHIDRVGVRIYVKGGTF